MLAQGSWYFNSPSDERWRAHGRGTVGMFCGLDEVPEAKAELERLKLMIGEEVPVDLEFGYMKD